ncbi:MAG: C39 family peptidase [Candidatus Sungbacteria bacterium]|uniref:C39 family peptidase n=1 Tax=Candidatus Sungiibacteriota bacterium TaxID=2750080 RepID=A0A933DU04_9BACT|nr:C39 family peptidase [Candidatus Sungbacteria bacterium]
MHLPFRFGNAARGTELAASVLGIAIGVSVWQHATLGMPVLEARTSYPPPERLQPAVADIETLPVRVLLDVPFTTQAPFGDWSEPYDEACEEASVAMAMAWARGETINPERAHNAILNLVAFENYMFGYSNDTALRETAKLITSYYRYRKTQVLYDISGGDIRRALADGNLVVVPVAGALLRNPYYAVPPPYHMLVIRGYDDANREFITNDPGTKNGENYRYAYDVLERAIHDWTGSDQTVIGGRKGMIVITK